MHEQDFSSLFMPSIHMAAKRSIVFADDSDANSMTVGSMIATKKMKIFGRMRASNNDATFLPPPGVDWDMNKSTTAEQPQLKQQQQLKRRPPLGTIPNENLVREYQRVGLNNELQSKRNVQSGHLKQSVISTDEDSVVQSVQASEDDSAESEEGG